MSKKIVLLLSLVAAVALTGCASKSLVGKVDLISVGAGPKPPVQDAHAVVEERHLNAQVFYTPQIATKEQKVSKKVKFVAGDALTKEFSGEPKFVADYLNKWQGFKNLALIVDKNGVVAWQGHITRAGNLQKSQGITGRGITGTKKMSFDDAINKYGLDQKTTKYKKDQEIISTKKGLFGGYKGANFYNQKVPEMEVVSSNGQKAQLSSLIENGKPTLLLFFDAKGKEGTDLGDVAQAGANFMSMMKGGSASEGVPNPDRVLTVIEDSYYK